MDEGLGHTYPVTLEWYQLVAEGKVNLGEIQNLIFTPMPALGWGLFDSLIFTVSTWERCTMEA